MSCGQQQLLHPELEDKMIEKGGRQESTKSQKSMAEKKNLKIDKI